MEWCLLVTAVWRQWYCTAASPSSANGMHVFRKGTHRVRKDVQVLHVWTQQEAGEHVQWWRGEGLVVTRACASRGATTRTSEPGSSPQSKDRRGFRAEWCQLCKGHCLTLRSCVVCMCGWSRFVADKKQTSVAAWVLACRCLAVAHHVPAPSRWYLMCACKRTGDDRGYCDGNHANLTMEDFKW